MKKKFLGLFMTLSFIFTVGMSNVSAAVLTTNEIYNILHKEMGDSVQLNNNIITINGNSEDGFEYTMDLKHENNILSFTNDRDVSKMTQEQRVTYAMYDGLMSMAIVMSLLESYGIEDFSSINEEEFGITVVEGEEVSYEGTIDAVVEENDELDDPNVNLESTVDGSANVSMKSTELKNFSIDMVKFDEAATKYNGNSNNDSVKEETTKEETIEKVEEQTKEEIKTELEEVVVKEDTTNEKNPQTGIANIGMITILFVLISLVSYLILKNKKMFVK